MQHTFLGDIDTAEDVLCKGIDFLTAKTCRAIIQVEDFQVEWGSAHSNDGKGRFCN
jgi:hypothetical protein